MRSDDPLDLSALDPTADATRFEARLRAIRQAAAPSFATHAASARGALWRGVTSWTRPALAAAAVILLLAVSTLTLGEPADSQSVESSGIAEAMGIPQSVITWMGPDRPPTDEILVAPDLR